MKMSKSFQHYIVKLGSLVLLSESQIREVENLKSMHKLKRDQSWLYNPTTPTHPQTTFQTNCIVSMSQNSDCYDTPICQDTPISQDTTIFQDTPICQDTPVSQDTTIFQDTPVCEDTPVHQDTTVFQETPDWQETPVCQESLICQDTLSRNSTLSKKQNRHFGLSNYQLSFFHCLLPITNCLLPITNCRLPMTKWPNNISISSQFSYELDSIELHSCNF